MDGLRFRAQLEKEGGVKGGNVQFVISKDLNQQAKRVAAFISSRIFESVDEYHIGLTVGATTACVYSELRELYEVGTADFTNCHFWIFDEFFMADGDPRALSSSPLNSSLLASPSSFSASSRSGLNRAPHFREIEKTFFSALPSSPSSSSSSSSGVPSFIHSSFSHYVNNDGDLEKTTESLKKEINERPLDLVVVTISPEGNIGWLRNTEDLKQEAHVVDISSSNPIFSKGYSQCVTLGLGDVMKAKEVIVLSVGKNKAGIVSEIVTNKSKECVLTTLLLNHPRVICFLDIRAASSLPQVTSLDSKTMTINNLGVWNSSSLPLKARNIVCISPHPDDSCISAGATLNFLCSDNKITLCVATDGHRSYIENTTKEERILIRQAEASAEGRALNANGVSFLSLPLYDRGSVHSDEDIEIIEEFLLKSEADVVFLPHTADTHPTHRAVLIATLYALQKILANGGSPFQTYMYEGPWALFPPKTYNIISSPPPDCFIAKMDAIDQHKSQTGRTRYDKAAESLSVLRGSLVPEQDLAGFGGNPPKLEEKVELFIHHQLTTTTDVQFLLDHFTAHQVPIRKTA